MNVKELESEIKKHRVYYYSGNACISDKEYDALEDSLKELDPKNELFNSVGVDIQSSFFMSKHQTKMLSLQKEINMDNLIKWIGNRNVVYSYKMDGFAISITYKNIGKGIAVLHKAVTRGNGEEGEDITSNVIMIDNIPKEIMLNPNIKTQEVRGEIIIKRKDFDTIIDKGIIPKDSSIRNIVSGSCRHKNPFITKQRKLSFFVYDSLFDNNRIFDTHMRTISFCQNQGFEVAPTKISNDAETEIMEYSKKRNKLPYLTDGLVYRVNDINEWINLGTTSHHPKGSIAFKLQSESKITTIKDIEWNGSRTGRINPVAILEPVELSGAIVQRATLHNLSFMEDNSIGIHSKVFIERSGEVIPKITGVYDYPVDEIEYPKFCPSCNSPTILDKSDSGTKTLKCSNKHCAEIEKSKLLHFAKTIEMKGISDKLIEKLYDKNILIGILDFFFITKDELLSIEGIQEKSANKILKIINDSKNCDQYKFIASLGVPGVGCTASKLLIDEFETVEYIIRDRDYYDFISIDGIGDTIANDLNEYLNKNREYLNSLIDVFNFKKADDKINILNGLKIVITGSFNNFKRSDLKTLIENNGGKCQSSISIKTDLLLCGEDAGSKKDKAEKLGVKIVEIDEFINILEG